MLLFKNTTIKTLATIFLIFLSLSVYGQDYYIVNAKNGLNVRAEGNLSSEKIAKLRFGTIVEIVAETDKILRIKDNGQAIKGKMVKIKYRNEYLSLEDGVEGYVFDAYLKKMKNEVVVVRTKIDKPEYTELFKKATIKIYKPQKISNLDSIKTILKGRVEWFTDEENDFTTIQSITADNGLKRSIGTNDFDIEFSKNYSCYYPEHDILFLVGGHGSDVCFSIKTGEDELTIGNPEYMIPSPKNTYRLNGYFEGQECIYYFFQKKEDEEFTFLTEFNLDYDICYFKDFYWINETEFIYTKLNYEIDHKNGIEEYFKGKIEE